MTGAAQTWFQGMNVLYIGLALLVILTAISQYLHSRCNQEDNSDHRSPVVHHQAGQNDDHIPAQAQASHLPSTGVNDLKDQIDSLETEIKRMHSSVSQLTELVGWPAIIGALETMPRSAVERTIRETITWPVVFARIPALDPLNLQKLLHILTRYPSPLVFLSIFDEYCSLQAASGEQCSYADEDVVRNILGAVYSGSRTASVSAYYEDIISEYAA